MKKMFLTLVFVFAGIISLDAMPMKEGGLTIITSCGTTRTFDNYEDFTDDQVFDMIDFFDFWDCELGGLVF